MVGEGVLFGRTLARAEPLTTLVRSAHSRVSLVARCNAAYEDTLTSLHRSVTSACHTPHGVIQRAGAGSRPNSLEGCYRWGVGAERRARKRAGSWSQAREGFEAAHSSGHGMGVSRPRGKEGEGVPVGSVSRSKRLAVLGVGTLVHLEPARLAACKRVAAEEDALARLTGSDLILQTNISRRT